MTDRHGGYIVTLCEDIRDDDAEPNLTALRMVSGVLSVTPLVTDSTHSMARERVRREYRDKVWEFLRDLE